jgi:transcriptional regulator with XRE-family HTH domain
VKTVKNNFTRELDAALAEARVNKSELARRMQGQPSLISRWYSGVYPRVDTIQRIASALGTEAERFLQHLPPSMLSQPSKAASFRPHGVSVNTIIHGDLQPAASSGLSLSDGPAHYSATSQHTACHKAAEQAAAEIRSRLLDMCTATSLAERTMLQTQCMTRIEELNRLCELHQTPR